MTLQLAGPSGLRWLGWRFTPVLRGCWAGCCRRRGDFGKLSPRSALRGCNSGALCALVSPSQEVSGSAPGWVEVEKGCALLEARQGGVCSPATSPELLGGCMAPLRLAGVSCVFRRSLRNLLKPPRSSLKWDCTGLYETCGDGAQEPVRAGAVGASWSLGSKLLLQGCVLATWEESILDMCGTNRVWGGCIRTWGCSVCTSCTLVLNHSAQPTRLPHAGQDFSFLFGLKIPWGVSPRPGRGLPCPPGRPPSSHPIAGRAWRGAGGGIPNSHPAAF